MADFAQWGEAVSRGLGWEPGSFLNRYHENRRDACESALDDCEVAHALRGMIDCADGPWAGMASELLGILPRHAHHGVTKSAQWPKSPRALSCALRRIAPQLRMTGIAVSFDRIGNTRLITISPSQASAQRDHQLGGREAPFGVRIARRQAQCANLCANFFRGVNVNRLLVTPWRKLHKCACEVSFVLWFIPSSKSGNDLGQICAQTPHSTCAPAG